MIDPVMMSSISWVEFQHRFAHENLVVFIVGELACNHLRRIACIGGHYENQWCLTEGIEFAMRGLNYAHDF
jgi:hypothetical protein